LFSRSDAGYKDLEKTTKHQMS